MPRMTTTDAALEINISLDQVRYPGISEYRSSEEVKRAKEVLIEQARIWLKDLRGVSRVTVSICGLEMFPESQATRLRDMGLVLLADQVEAGTASGHQDELVKEIASLLERAERNGGMKGGGEEKGC